MSPSAEGAAPGGRAFSWIDIVVAAGLFAFIAAIVGVARQWSGPLTTSAEVHLEARFLPYYAFLSLSRGVAAYVVSFLFTLVWGYTMARVKGAERMMLPVLDILQSIPVLGFLPTFVLGLVHLFPERNVGLELASVLMIFTGQVWNMTFSFYGSLKAVPPELVDVCRIARLSWWQRFVTLDLSFAARGLLWNSMMSMAGGWFFLMVSEAFVLGKRDFRLPGLGSYMSLAIERGDVGAQWRGVLAMLAMIVALNQVVWRPLVAWSARFGDDALRAGDGSWLWNRILRSRLWQLGHSAANAWLPRRGFGWKWPASERWPVVRRYATRATLASLGVMVLWGMVNYLALLVSLTATQWWSLATSALATFARVLAAVFLATLWTVPVGVMIGRSPRAGRVAQPIIQMCASFPAPMIFPVVVGAMLSLGIGLAGSSVLLLLLGTQWYILFNVISGAAAIPKQLWEVAALGRFSSWRRWTRLILPAVFPSLLTGWITAVGGAWNASIVAECMTWRGQTLSTMGIGAAISQATDTGAFNILAAAVGVMAFTVVIINRLVWRPLTMRAQTRFAMDT